jgi:hypothetical protein
VIAPPPAARIAGDTYLFFTLLKGKTARDEPGQPVSGKHRVPRVHRNCGGLSTHAAVSQGRDNHGRTFGMIDSFEATNRVLDGALANKPQRQVSRTNSWLCKVK